MAAAITWRTSRISGTNGFVNIGGQPVAMFSVSYTIDRDDIDAGKPYILRSTLPGFARNGLRFTTQAVAQARATEVLAAYAKAIS